MPALRPKGSYSVSIRLSLRTLAAGTYFVYAEMPVQSSELAGRSYTNSDRAGFTVDGMGPIRQRCTEPGRGGSPNVVDPLYRHQWHLRNIGRRLSRTAAGSRQPDLRLGHPQPRPVGDRVKVLSHAPGLEPHPGLLARQPSGPPDASVNLQAPPLAARAGRGPAAWADGGTADPFNVQYNRRITAPALAPHRGQAATRIGGSGECSRRAVSRGYTC